MNEFQSYKGIIEAGKAPGAFSDEKTGGLNPTIRKIVTTSDSDTSSNSAIEIHSSARAASTNIVVTDREIFTSGGLTVKELVTGKIGAHTVSLVERPYEETFVKNWEQFRNAGLPVVSTLRTTPAGTMIMTDLKANGSELYGKSLRYVLKTNFTSDGTVVPNGVRRLPAPGVDEHFITITDPDHFGEVEAKLDEHIERANRQQLILPTDDPIELMVHPDQTWEFIILDLQSYDPPSAKAPEHNELSKTFFMRDILDIRRRLLQST